MADYAPPSGPPPPHVPPGWKAVWNEQYKEWFFVNTYTKASTWEKPTEPAQGQDHGGPPAYDQGSSRPVGPEKGGNTYGNTGESDEALARRLQAEEHQRAQGQDASRGHADSYYTGAPQQYNNQSSSSGQPYAQAQAPQDQGKKGLFGKLGGGLAGGLLGSKLSGGSKPHNYGQQQQYQQYPPQQGYGQYPPQQGYGQYPPQGYPPGYGQPAYAQPPRRGGGGMGALGGAGLGLGAGMLGGVLLGEAMDGGDGGGDGGGYGGDDGGDYGGGDGGGFGGDDGGGDGGGDF